MEIRFPRKITLGFKPVYGMTIRQLLYVAVAATIGGLIILVGPLQGTGLIVRLVIGLGIVAVGLVLAFLRPNGMGLDQWLPIAAQYIFRPRKRVWRKRDMMRWFLNRAPGPTPQPQTAKPQAEAKPAGVRLEAKISTEASRQETAAIVLIEAGIVVALIALTVYLQRGGLSEVKMVLLTQLGH